MSDGLCLRFYLGLLFLTVLYVHTAQKNPCPQQCMQTRTWWTCHPALQASTQTHTCLRWRTFRKVHMAWWEAHNLSIPSEKSDTHFVYLIMCGMLSNSRHCWKCSSEGKNTTWFSYSWLHFVLFLGNPCCCHRFCRFGSGRTSVLLHSIGVSPSCFLRLFFEGIFLTGCFVVL